MDLFEVKTPVKKFNASSVEITDKIGHPYVVRSSTNNGIRGYINEDEKYLNEGNTFSFGQDTATIFWQEKPFFTGDKIKILKPKFACNSEIANYIMNGIAMAFVIFHGEHSLLKLVLLKMLNFFSLLLMMVFRTGRSWKNTSGQ